MEPLIEAYLSGNEKRLRQLVLSGADVNRPMREYPGDILLEPCLAKNTRLVKFLLSHGAQPTGKLLSDLIGYSGVLSVRYLARLLRRLLKAGAAPNAQERGHTLLWWAAASRVRATMRGWCLYCYNSGRTPIFGRTRARGTTTHKKRPFCGRRIATKRLCSLNCLNMGQI